MAHEALAPLLLLFEPRDMGSTSYLAAVLTQRTRALRARYKGLPSVTPRNPVIMFSRPAQHAWFG